MILRYVASNASAVPAIADSVEVDDDGSLRGWRSVAEHAVGMFEGRLPDDELAAVREVVSAVADLVPPAALRLPDSGVETLELAGHEPISLPTRVDGGPWEDLAAAARGLVGGLHRFPAWAIGLRTGERCALVHLGDRPVDVDLTAATLRVVRWRGYYEPAGDDTIACPGSRVAAGPGWEFALPDTVPQPGVTIHRYVTFGIVSGGATIPVQVCSLPPAALS